VSGGGACGTGGTLSPGGTEKDGHGVNTAALIFLVTYAGIAVGRIPGLMLDRSGIATLGAIAMVVAGCVTFGEAPGAIDFPTVLLLYGLMIVSAQLRLGGFYTRTAHWILGWLDRPRLFLLLLMATSALLSALLANDIICLAFTPVLTVSLLEGKKNPVPFLLGLAVSSNIGSAATLIGNPQNMLIGQVGRLDFGAFLLWSIVPTLVSLVLSFFLITWIYRGRFAATGMKRPGGEEPSWPDFDPWQSLKGLAAVAVITGLFFTDIPRELSAIAVAGFLLCSRKLRSRRILELVDWHLITLFCALFIIIHGFSATGTPVRLMESLGSAGIDLSDPLTLTGISVLFSNLVSNVPAVMLLKGFLDVSQTESWYVLAMSSTFAGNLVVIGSIANLIVIEQARSLGVEVGFLEHARTGIPVTLVSLGVLVVWFLM
jgi:Na+/H+ antiporter NhaD/arsenite permease-like protein